MLKLILPIILFFHGIIHFVGFAKAFKYVKVAQLTMGISKQNGMCWLLATLFFITSGIMYLLKKDSWIYIAFIAVIISQILIFSVWKDAKIGTILNIIILFIIVSTWSIIQFENKFKNDIKRQMAETNLSKNDLLLETDIGSLPLPVQKYIRYVGAIGKPKPKNMKIVFDGEMREKGKDFFKFTSTQYNFFNNPARLFFMKASMLGTVVPGYHCYQNGTASMQVKLFGLFNVVNIKGNELNKAETVTLFNDMCLAAPATLIDKRIEWILIDDFSAKAFFTNGNIKIAATLYFNFKGQLINFISDDRYAVKEKTQIRFSTPVKNYTLLNGRQIMQYGEAVWHYPEGEFVYGKFNLRSIEYNVGN